MKSLFFAAIAVLCTRTLFALDFVVLKEWSGLVEADAAIFVATSKDFSISTDIVSAETYSKILGMENYETAGPYDFQSTLKFIDQLNHLVQKDPDLVQSAGLDPKFLYSLPSWVQIRAILLSSNLCYFKKKAITPAASTEKDKKDKKSGEIKPAPVDPIVDEYTFGIPTDIQTKEQLAARIRQKAKGGIRGLFFEPEWVVPNHATRGLLLDETKIAVISGGTSFLEKPFLQPVRITYHRPHIKSEIKAFIRLVRFAK